VQAGIEMNGEENKRIGQHLRQLRRQHRLTQEQLSAKLQVEGCDLTRSALAKIEVGQRSIYPDEIKALKKVLQISYEEILDEKEKSV
jgi:transcriptional regulator with XRE-family HTH domain